MVVGSRWGWMDWLPFGVGAGDHCPGEGPGGSRDAKVGPVNRGTEGAAQGGQGPRTEPLVWTLGSNRCQGLQSPRGPGPTWGSQGAAEPLGPGNWLRGVRVSPVGASDPPWNLPGPRGA